MSSFDKALDKIFVNRSKEKKKKSLFDKAMNEGWNYQKFKEESLKQELRPYKRWGKP